MYLELITGGAGSGKSSYVEKIMENCISSKQKVIVIVPERFSHTEEKTLCDRFGGLGFNGIEVSTFSKMLRRLRPADEYLTKSGKQMLISKAAKLMAESGDGIFGTSYRFPGFIDKVSAAVGEFHRNLITPNILLSYKQNDILSKKLTALGEIYQKYNELLGTEFNDPDENMERLAGIIEAEGGFSDCNIFIDGFSDMLLSHYRVIEALIKKSNAVYVTFTINESGMRNSDGIFYPVNRCMEKLSQIGKNLEIDVKHKHIDGEFSYITAPDIKYFLTNYDQYQPTDIIPNCENIHICKTYDRYSEVWWVAGKIMKEVRTKGLRFRNIGIIAGNLEAYIPIAESVFSECNIPYYIDKNSTASQHHITKLVMSIFDVVRTNWNYESVFSYLRSGYIYRKTENGIERIDQSEFDKLELYVKSRGIRGKKLWLTDEGWNPKRSGLFGDGKNDEKLAEEVLGFDEIRHEVMAPFVKFCDKIKGKRRATEISVALFEFLEDIHLCEGLVYEQEILEQNGLNDEAVKIGEIWGILLELLDQIVMIIGDDYISREDYQTMLMSAFSQCDVDTVPMSADCITVGVADQSRPVRVKTLFVLGAVKGELPMADGDGSIINNAERTILEEYGIHLPLSDDKNFLAEFNVYNSLTAACDNWYITVPTTTDAESAPAECDLIKDLKRTFGQDIVTVPTNEEIWESILISKKRAFYEIVKDLSEKSSIPPEMKSVILPNLAEYVNEYSEEDMKDLLERYKACMASISADTAQKLFGERPYSASALQNYNKCPFMYYIQYGLGVQTEEKYSVGASDVGNILHNMLCEFCRTLQSDAKTPKESKEAWESLTEEKAKAIIYDMTEKQRVSVAGSNSEYNPEKLSLIYDRTKKILVKSVMEIRESLISGDFYACDFEHSFVTNISLDNDSIDIKGIMDRIDFADSDGGKQFRIIDYKSGSQKFSLSGICQKSDLQLVLYALAAEKLYDNAQAKEIVYNKVREIRKNASEPKKSDVTYSGIVIGEADTDSKIVTEAEPVSQENFELIKKYVKKVIIDNKNSIRKGEIKPFPSADSNKNACDYCDYSAICMHNPQRNDFNFTSVKDGDVYEIMESEVAENE